MGIHRSPKYFESPDEFNPDRFMPENAHLQAKQSLITFSMGPRNCIGKNIFFLHFVKFYRKNYFIVYFRKVIWYVDA